MRVTTNSCTAAAPSYGDIFHSRNSYYPYEENTLTKFVHTNFTCKRFSIEAEREETPFLFPGIITCEILFLAHEIKIIISRECVFKGLGEKSHSTFKFSVGNGYKASVTLLNSSSVCSIEFFDFDNFLLGCKPQGTSIISNRQIQACTQREQQHNKRSIPHCDIRAHFSATIFERCSQRNPSPLSSEFAQQWIWPIGSMVGVFGAVIGKTRSILG